MGDNLTFPSNSTCSQDLGLHDCSTSPGTWEWSIEVQGTVNDDASQWNVSQVLASRTKGFTKDSSGNLVAFDDQTAQADDTPESSFVQQTAGQKTIFWIDGPGHFTNRSGIPIDSMTEIENFTSTVCNKITTSVCTSVNWYVKIVVDPGSKLDFTNSAAGFGNLSLSF